MTVSQRENAELLRDLKRPAELISANTGIDLGAAKAWLRSGKWPKHRPTQLTLFDAGAGPRTTKPVDAEDAHGLHLSSSPTAKSEFFVSNPLEGLLFT